MQIKTVKASVEIAEYIKIKIMKLINDIISMTIKLISTIYILIFVKNI